MALLYLLCNNFVSNQYLNLKLNDYTHQSCSIDLNSKRNIYYLIYKNVAIMWIKEVWYTDDNAVSSQKRFKKIDFVINLKNTVFSNKIRYLKKYYKKY